MRAKWNDIKLPTSIARHSYDADHAMAVHEGASYQDDRPDMPGRPWVDATLREVDFSQMVADQHHEFSGNKSLADSISLAFALANEDLGVRFSEAMLTPRWEWPNETQRRNGAVVGSPRDIYDMGGLHDSYSLVFVDAA